jgi:hypothetical protein
MTQDISTTQIIPENEEREEKDIPLQLFSYFYDIYIITLKHVLLID